MHATRCSVNHAIQTSPGAMVYGRDMLMDVPLIANLLAILERRQLLIDKNLMRMNSKRINYNYKVGDQIMIKRYDPTKLQKKLHGPYPIQQVFTNGTVRVKRAELIDETYNIRKIVPYKGPTIATE